MAFVKKPEEYIISEIKSKAMDKINMGGTFLQQSQSTTIGGLPVATRKGGGLGGAALGGALGSVVSAVQQAGDIASLVQNPMSAVQGAVGSAISGISSKLSGPIAGKLTGGQLSNLTTKLGSLSTALSNFEAHTSNLSGLSSAISDTVPDFKKITSVGETLSGLGTDSTNGFIANTVSALKSGNELNNVKDTLGVTVQNKMDQILRLDENTISGQTQIASLVTEIDNLLNNQANVMSEIVTFDTNNFNEASNNVTASQDVIGLAEQYNNPDSVSYALLVSTGVAKESTIKAFDQAINQAEA